MGVAWREEGTEERDTGKGGGQGQHRDQVVETVRHGDPIAVLIKSGFGEKTRVLGLNFRDLLV